MGKLLSTRRGVKVAATSAGVALVGALLLGAAPASGETTGPAAPGTSVTSSTGGHPERPARADRLPTELRADLRELAAAEVSERPALRAEIRAKAADGTYGDRAQQRVERIAERVAALPDDLEADLLATRDLAGTERREAVRTIRDGALAGDYGPEVQECAEAGVERREDRRDNRADRSEDRKGEDG